MSDAPNLEENPIHQELAEQARRENKPPPSSSRFGAVATSRFPEAETLTERAAEIRKQDEGMIQSNEGSLYYKPVLVCGVELKLEPLQPSIGTIIHGIDLAEDVVGNAEMVTFIRKLWLDRKVIMFREQNHLTPLQMKAFAMSFGDVQARFGEKGHEPNSAILTNSLKIPEVPEMLVLISDENAPSAAANWHSDATWQKKPPMGSILLCREAPPIGGDTCFCNCYAMWEGLSTETRERVEQLTALHVGGYGHKMDGVTPSSLHPVARTHPETGRTLLYVQKKGFVKRFAEEHGILEDEERRLQQEMKNQEGRLEYTCRFRWEPGSIAMWDNRAVLHSASPDFWPHRRRMERLTILDYDESRRVPYYAP